VRELVVDTDSVAESGCDVDLNFDIDFDSDLGVGLGIDWVDIADRSRAADFDVAAADYIEVEALCFAGVSCHSFVD
jgi:hypothetical protein